MDEFYFMRSHVPAFGSWHCNNECFESARQAGLLHYSYSEERENDGKSGYPREKQWAVCESAPKAVDEDLYKISPHLLRQHAKKKRAWTVFSSCLRPTCVC